MTKVRVAVVGNGNLGRWHCQKASSIPEIEFVALVDICEKARKRAKDQYPEIKVVEAAEEIINIIDAAIIVTPISTHYDLTKYFLQNGKHVFCEKSATETFEQITDIQKILEREGPLVFQVGHSERYHQIWEELGVYDEFLKMPYSSVRINRYGPYRGRDADVSVVEDLLIHDVDLILNLFDEAPSAVNARGYKIRSDKWDHVEATFTYDTGRKVSIVTGRNHIEVARNLEMINESGCMQIDFLNNKFLFASNYSKVDSVCESRSYSKRDHLYLEQVDFINSIQKGMEISVGIEDASRAIRILDKTLESLTCNQTISLK